MGKIHLLGQHTIDQIAAGEVIDRPVSVVKELTENAIDAGASAVTIEIKEGGSGLIRVTDNGSGILKEDLQIAFKRHATSKIGDAADLLTVSSLGFRGEALSSICAVARVELITRTHHDLVGCRYVIEGGEECSLEEVGAPKGTTIIVRDLFFNTPARKKFLKSPQTEGSHISDLVSKMALSRPDISFRLIINGQNKFHTSGNHNLKDVIYQIYGRDIARELIPLEVKGSFFELHGYLGKPLISRGNRNYEIYFINGRYIKSGLIAKAIEEGYRNFLMQHKFPLCVFNLVIDAEFTDVNVHPAKMEIRFRNQQFLYEELTHGVRKALTAGELAPHFDVEGPKEKKPVSRTDKDPSPRGPEPFEVQRRQQFLKETEGLYRQPEPVTAMHQNKSEPVTAMHEHKSDTVKAMQQNKPEPVKAMQQNKPEPVKPMHQNKPEPMTAMQQHKSDTVTAMQQHQPESVTDIHQQNLFEEKLLTMDTVNEVKLVGQLFNTYWVAEYKDTMLLIDQHAAHEKVNYERILKELKNKEYTCQQMKPPKVVSFTAAMQENYRQAKAMISQLGFEIEEFGGNAYAIYGMPDNLVGIQPEELLEELLENGEDSALISLDRVYEKAATMACKSAIKGNQRISEPEACKLIADLVTLENPYTCPHGRPTMIRMTQKELEKKFKRIL